MTVAAAGFQAYGSIYYSGGIASAGQVFGTAASKCTLFNASGEAQNVTTDPATNDRITIIVPGVYEVRYSFSFSGTGGREFTMKVYKNGASTFIQAIRKLGSAGDIGCGMVKELLDLAAGDYLEMYIAANLASSSYDLGFASLGASLIH